MKITFLLPQSGENPIGGFKVAYEYANGLARRGHQVTVCHIGVLRDNRSRWRMSDIKAFGEYASTLRKGNWKPDSWFHLDKRVALLWAPTANPVWLPRADAIVATWWLTAERLAEYPATLGRKFYLIQHLETFGGPKDRVMATWKAPLEKIVIARWLGHIAQENGERFHYIPNGMDFTRFGMDVTPSARNGLWIGMLYSRTTKWKGSADGVAALIELKKRYPELQAHLFGIESRAEDLPKWIEHQSNPSQAAIREIYNRSAIFLAPSWAEGWPLPPCEAMACGAALVATNIGGHLEYCIDGETALLAEVSNPASLADRTAWLIEHPDERIALAHRGQEYVQRFTWERALTSLENVLAGEAPYSEIA